jgi:hypothetical protein
LHRAIDTLSEESLDELTSFVEFLHFKSRPAGSRWAKDLYDLFAPVRQAAAESGMTEAEIDQLLDEELDAVRRERDV